MLAMWPHLMPLANQMNPHQQQQALYDNQCLQNQLMLGMFSHPPKHPPSIQKYPTSSILLGKIHLLSSTQLLSSRWKIGDILESRVSNSC